jgi:hypothetical protein
MKFGIKYNRIGLLIGISAIFSCFYRNLSAQGFYETAVRQSQQTIFGSPKAMAMGGAMMGTGADPTAPGYNPAAAGLARKSCIQASLMPFLHTANSDFRSSEVSSEQAGMPFGSFGLCLADRKDAGEGFRGGVFSVSYNRTQQSSRKVSWEGDSPFYRDGGKQSKNSIIDYWLDNLNQPGYRPQDIILNPQPVFADNFKNDVVMAYDAYLLDTSGGSFVSAFPQSDLDKSGAFSQTMTSGNWNFGYAADFDDRFFLGFSVLYHTSGYSADVQYRERIRNVYVDPANPDYLALQRYRGVDFTLSKSLSQTCRGVGGNIGFLYKASDNLRLSAAVQLPTLSWITEKYSPKINYNYNGLNYFGEVLNSGEVTWFENEFSYKLRLPARYRLGLTWIAGKSGMLEAGVEITNPGSAKLYDGDGYNFTRDNPQISANFGTQVNWRLGGELRLGEFRLRGGMAYLPSALKENAVLNLNIPGDMLFLTGGIGARFDLWYWDAALVTAYYSLKNNYVEGYDPDINSRINLLQLHLGLGFYL